MSRRKWTQQELLVVLYLYCCLPYRRLTSSQPDIIRFARMMDRTPAALKMRLFNFGHIDPGLGRKGLKHVSGEDREAWKKMEGDWTGFLQRADQAISELYSRHCTGFSSQKPPALTELPASPLKEGGRDFFRHAVLSAYDSRCCVSGLSLKSLPSVSRIVPWRDSEQNRLNPRNGLALSAPYDRAFADGIITLDEDFRVRVSRQEQPAKDDRSYQSALQQYHGHRIELPKKFLPNQELLRYHREEIFRPPLLH